MDRCHFFLGIPLHNIYIYLQIRQFCLSCLLNKSQIQQFCSYHVTLISLASSCARVASWKLWCRQDGNVRTVELYGVFLWQGNLNMWGVNRFRAPINLETGWNKWISSYLPLLIGNVCHRAAGRVFLLSAFDHLQVFHGEWCPKC